jgi:hypothetical protein
VIAATVKQDALALVQKSVEVPDAMKALILYVVFVVVGALISVGVGYYVEKEFSSAASLVVFLAMFFANFAVSWIAVVFVMDGNLKDIRGEAEQREIERAGRTAMLTREKSNT